MQFKNIKFKTFWKFEDIKVIRCLNYQLFKYLIFNSNSHELLVKNPLIILDRREQLLYFKVFMSVFCGVNCIPKNLKVFLFKIIFFMFSYRFNMLMLKIIFKK